MEAGDEKLSQYIAQLDGSKENENRRDKFPCSIGHVQDKFLSKHKSVSFKKREKGVKVRSQKGLSRQKFVLVFVNEKESGRIGSYNNLIGNFVRCEI